MALRRIVLDHIAAARAVPSSGLSTSQLPTAIDQEAQCNTCTPRRISVAFLQNWGARRERWQTARKVSGGRVAPPSPPLSTASHKQIRPGPNKSDERTWSCASPWDQLRGSHGLFGNDRPLSLMLQDQLRRGLPRSGTKKPPLRAASSHSSMETMRGRPLPYRT